MNAVETVCENVISDQRLFSAFKMLCTCKIIHFTLAEQTSGWCALSVTALRFWFGANRGHASTDFLTSCSDKHFPIHFFQYTFSNVPVLLCAAMWNQCATYYRCPFYPLNTLWGIPAEPAAPFPSQEMRFVIVLHCQYHQPHSSITN